jgi:AhpD family alkylhydroperoxidase
VADLWEAFAARPQLARTLARHVEEAGNGTVPRRTKELVALMVSWLSACTNCVEVHAEMARALGVEQAALDELGDFARSAHFTEAERAALSAAVSLTREPRALPPAVRAALDEQYEPGEIVEVIATIGLYNYITRVNNALASSP